MLKASSHIALFMLFALVVDVFAMTPVNIIGVGEVDSCATYNEARSRGRLDEGINNMLISSEYLECSLNIEGFYDIESSKRKHVLSQIYSNFNVVSIPTSISQKITKIDTFEKLNADIDFSDDKISLMLNGSSITLYLKGRFYNDYLVWIVNEISESAYYSYYPAIVEVSDKDVTARPLYKSGY